MKIIVNLKILLFSILLFVPGCLYASSISGSTLEFDFITPDSLHVKAVVYRDCNGVPISASPINLYDKCNNKTYTYSTQQSGGSDITPICSSSCTRCSNGACNFAFGIQEYYMTTYISIKNIQCCDLLLSYELCCPSPSFTLNTAYFNSIYVRTETYINRCNYRNSKNYTSTHFQQPPMLLGCLDQCFYATQAVSHAIGDSISYTSVQAPHVSYYKGYSPAEPLTYDGFPDSTGSWSYNACKGFHLDNVTGNIQFKPTKNDATNICIKAAQYQRDSSGKYVLTSYIQRQVILGIISCKNSPPVIKDEFADTSVRKWNVCVGTPLKFSINTKDSNSSDNLTMTVEKNISKASFNINKGTRPSGTFSWKPVAADVRKEPYIFNISVTDNACPIKAVKRLQYMIYVRDSIPPVVMNKTDSGCGKWYFSAPYDTAYHIKRDWYINGSRVSDKEAFSFQFWKNGTYTLHLNETALSGCAQDYYASIVVSVLPNLVTYNKSAFFCQGVKTTLSASGASKYLWSPATGLDNPKSQFPLLTVDSSRNYIVKGTDLSGCAAWDTVSVKSSALYINMPGAKNWISRCGGTSAFKPVVKIRYNPKVTVKWAPATGIVYSNDSATQFNVSQTTTFSLTLTDSTGCRLTKIFTVLIDNPKANAGADKNLCYGDSIQLDAAKGYSKYSWSSSETAAIANSAAPYVSPHVSASYYLLVTDSFGCSSQSWDTVKVNVTKPIYTLAKTAAICKGDMLSIDLNNSDPAYTYLWSPATDISATTSGKVKVYPGNDRIYHVQMKDSKSGCIFNDSIAITVDKDCVYPGDLNNDKTADYKDLLYLGVGNGKSGPKRTDALSLYIGQHAIDWAYQAGAAKVNYKHIDADGNGKIEAADSLAIIQNYGKLHNKKDGAATGSRSGNPPLYFKFSRDTFYAEDTVRASLYLGSADLPVAAAYGVAMQYNAFTKYMKPNSCQFSFSCDWLCGNNYYMLRSAGPGGYGSIVRTDQVNSAGYGKIGDISYILSDTAAALYNPDGDIIPMEIQDQEVIDNNGFDIIVSAVNTQAVVFGSRRHSSIKSLPSGTLKAIIYPNPFTDKLKLELETANATYFSLSCFDVLGREQIIYHNKPIPAGSSSFNLSAPEAGMLTEGMYYFSIRMNDELKMIPVVKIK